MSPASPGAWRRVADWIDDRTGFRKIRDFICDEPLPPGTGWWFTLGSVLLFGLGLQTVTGVALALYYAPTPDHAWDSIRFITTAVRAGAFLRGLHHWGASLIVIVAVLHLVRVVAFGSYRKPRELNWVVGVLLLLVILAFGLTGYLLPWDQRAYWATVVTINVSKLTPVAGEWVAALLRGGPDIGALTLTRWYATHVLVLPVILAGLVGFHLYLLRRHGISGPIPVGTGGSTGSTGSLSVPTPARKPAEPVEPVEPVEPAEVFFPHQAARDVTMSVVAGIVLAVLAWRGAPALTPPADPSSSDYVPRPEWYYSGLFQLLKYFPGRLEVIGALVVPGIAVTALLLLPWLDRAGNRTVRSRRILLSGFGAALATVVVLTILGTLDRPADAGDRWNVRELAGVTLMTSGDRCRKCHVAGGIAPALEAGRITGTQTWLTNHVADPEVVGPGVREAPATDEQDLAAIMAALAHLRSTPPPALDPSSQALMTLVNRHCLKCHRVDGVGGTEGPDLSHAGHKLDASKIARRIANPKSVKADSEMTAFADKMSPQEIQAIADWLALKK
jgi:ubiquinol-cytochrome c reductase cytochrome b subunit